MSKTYTMFMNLSKSRTNKAGKTINHVVSETKAQFIAGVPSYTASGSRFVAQGNVNLFKVTKEGLAELKAKATLSDVIDLNRQRITDVKNDLRVLKSYEDTLKDYKAEEISLAQFVKALEKFANAGHKEATKLHSSLVSLIPSK